MNEPKLRIVERTDEDGRTVGGHLEIEGQGRVDVPAADLAAIRRLVPFDYNAQCFIAIWACGYASAGFLDTKAATAIEITKRARSHGC